jgi:hypothetical protein
MYRKVYFLDSLNLLPLCEAISSTPKHIARKFMEKCSRFADHILPVVSAVISRQLPNIDEELELLRGADFRQSEFVDLISNVEFNAALCGFHSQKSPTVYNLMPTQAVSK